MGKPLPTDEATDAFLARMLCGEREAWPQGWGDLARIWQRIEFHGIALILAEQEDVLAGWPEALADAVVEEAQLQVFWEESHKAALTKLLARLAEAKIDARLMKGTALAYSVYDRPAVRRRGDTDLLIRAADLPATRAALQDEGWTPREDPHGLFFQGTWLRDTGFGMVHAIDLHWQANDSPALQQVLQLEEYFAASVPLDGLAPGAKAPPHVLTFVQGAMNQAWHCAKGYFVGEDRVMGGHRLIWSRDNDLLAREFSDGDWQRLTRLACDRGVAAIVLSALEAAQRDCGTQVPGDVLAGLRGAEQTTALTQYLLESNQKREFLTDLRASPGLGAKASFLFANAFPKRRHLLGKYPQASGWPTPLLHIRRLAGLAARSVGIGAR